jgi:hypothetical protein
MRRYSIPAFWSFWLFLGVSFSAAQAQVQGPNPDQPADPIAIIKSSYDSQPYELYIGHPLCAEVLERREKENRDIVFATLNNAEAVARYLEGDTSFPPKSYYFTAQALSEELPHPQPFYNYQPTFSAVAWNSRWNGTCFTATAQVEVLRFVKIDRLRSQGCYECHSPSTDFSAQLPPVEEERAFKETVTIDRVRPNEFVLSSTMPLTSDARYQLECWGKVRERVAGFVHPSETLQHVNVLDEESGDRFELVVTPKHRFYTTPYNQKDFSWCTADKLEECQELYTGTSSQTPEVKTDDRHLRIESVREERLGYGSIESVPVYNLMVEGTNVYFVGNRVHRLLVHNIKEIW